MHTSSHYDQELSAISRQVISMGELLQGKLTLLLSLLNHPDPQKINAINHNDHAINALEIQIDEACQNIIAKRQPAASDLRFILAVGRMIVDLERIGDEYKKIVFMLKYLSQKHPTQLSALQQSHQLLSLTHQMFGTAMQAFTTLDAHAEQHLKEADHQVDEQYRQEHKALVLHMIEAPSLIEPYTQIMMINKSIERIGDHAKNLAEHIVYLVDGKNVRHFA